MTTKRKLIDFMDGGDGGQEPKQLSEAVPPQVATESTQIISAEGVRAEALKRMPLGAIEMFDTILPRLGIEMPSVVLLEGTTLEEAISNDLTLLNLMMAKVLANLQMQSNINQALARVDAAMIPRFAESLALQRKQNERSLYQSAMVAMIGGDRNSGFQFSCPSSYEIPLGWEAFADPEPEKSALPAAAAETVPPLH